jgi:arginase family enzyme
MLKLAPQVRLLDLDGSIADAQPRLLDRLGAACQVVPARDIGPHLRYMATGRQMQRLAARLDADSRNPLTLFGSGDFHHVTAALLRSFPISQPLSVVVFDRHPDWDRRSPVPCCGSWVAEALRMPYVQRVVVLGLGKEDIGGWRINVGEVRKLRHGKVALYPYDCPVSYGLGSGSGSFAQPSPETGPGPLPGTQTIRWQTVEQHLRPADWTHFLRRIFDDLPTQQVYLSIDKDCLTPQYAHTNWEPGHLELPQVLEGISLLATQRDIVGADITGEYSRPEIASPLFRWLAQSDRPDSAFDAVRGTPESTRVALERNEETNLQLLQAFGF